MAPDRDVRVLNSPSAIGPTATPATSPTSGAPQSPSPDGTDRTQPPTGTTQSGPSTQAPGAAPSGPDNRPTFPGTQTGPDNRTTAPGRPDNRATTPGPASPNYTTGTPGNPTHTDNRPRAGAPSRPDTSTPAQRSPDPRSTSGDPARTPPSEHPTRPQNRGPVADRPTRPEHRTPSPDQPTRPEHRIPSPNQPTRPEPRPPFSDNPTRPERRPTQDNTSNDVNRTAPQQNPTTQSPNRRSIEDWQNWFEQHEYNPNSSPWSTTPPGSPTDLSTTPAQSQTPTSHPANTPAPTTNPADHPTTPLNNTQSPSGPQNPADTAPATPDTPATPSDPTTPPVTHTPTSTALGDDPATHRVQNNLRNEGDFDVIFHADQNGTPLNNLTPDQIVDAIRSNPNYNPGTPIRLIACNTANNPDLARHIANELGAPVHTPSDAVGTPNKPDSPAHIRNNGTWTTHHPTTPEGHTPAPTTQTPTTPSTPLNPDEPVDYMGDEEPSDPPSAPDGPRSEADPPEDATKPRTMEEKLQDPDYRRKYYRLFPDGTVRVKNRKAKDADGEETPAVVVEDDGRWVAQEGLQSRVEYDHEAERQHRSPDDPDFENNPSGATPEDVQSLVDIAEEHAAARATALQRLKDAQQENDFSTARDLLEDRVKRARSAQDTDAETAAQAELDELREAAVDVRDRGEDLGEAAARHAINAQFPPSQGWTIEARHEEHGINEGPRQGRFDHIYRVRDADGNTQYVIYEAKGPRAQLGARGGHEQGTPKYFDLIIEQMRAGTAEEKALADELASSRKRGKLTYASVQAQVNPDNSYKGARVRPFNID